MIKYIIATISFGEYYVDMLLNYNIPSLLSPANVASINYENSRFLLYTSRQQEYKIKNSQQFQEFCKHIYVEIIYIEDMGLQGEQPYNITMRCQSHYMKVAAEHSANIIFNYSDVIWADGYLARLMVVNNENIRIVYTASVRVDFDVVVEKLESFRRGMTLQVSKQELVELSLNGLFIEYQRYIWNSDGYNNSLPAMVIYPVTENGYIINEFQMGPIMVSPSLRDRSLEPDESQLDSGNYLSEMVGNDFSKIHVFTDSDDMFIISLDSCTNYSHHFTQGLYESINLLQMAAWARSSTTEMQRYLFSKTLFVHKEPIDKSWDDIIRTSELMTNNILHLVDRLNDSTSQKKENYLTTTLNNSKFFNITKVSFISTLTTYVEKLIDHNEFDTASTIIVSLLSENEDDYYGGYLKAKLFIKGALAGIFNASENYFEAFGWVRTVLNHNPSDMDAITLSKILIDT